MDLMVTNLDLQDIRRQSTEEEFSSFLRREPKIKKAAGGTEFQLALRKVELLVDTDPTAPALENLFLKSLRSCSKKACNSFLFHLLRPELSGVRRAILNDPKVSANLSPLYDLKAFTHLEGDDRNVWLWLGRRLRESKDKAATWRAAIQNSGFREVQPE